MKISTAEKLFWFTGWAYDFTKVATILLVLALLVHYFLFSVLVVRGASMEPSYTDGQALLINKLAYTTSSPERGDVIAMFFPGETEKRFIKRIVGLPGETVRVLDGKVYIDENLVTETYLPDAVETWPEQTRKLNSGEYYVLGDNRDFSSDSRAWGAVPESFIIGKIGRELFRLSPQVSAAY